MNANETTTTTKVRRFQACAGCGSATLVQFLNLVRGGLCKACEARQLAAEDVDGPHMDDSRDGRERLWDEQAFERMGLGPDHDDLPSSQRVETHVRERRPLTVPQFAALKKLGHAPSDIRGLSIADASRLIQRGPTWLSAR